MLKPDERLYGQLTNRQRETVKAQWLPLTGTDEGYSLYVYTLGRDGLPLSRRGRSEDDGMTCEEMVLEHHRICAALTAPERAEHNRLEAERAALKQRMEEMQGGMPQPYDGKVWVARIRAFIEQPGGSMVIAYYYDEMQRFNDQLIKIGGVIREAFGEPSRRRALLTRLLRAVDYRHTSRRFEGLHVYRVAHDSPTGCQLAASFPDTTEYRQIVSAGSRICAGGQMGNMPAGGRY